MLAEWKVVAVIDDEALRPVEIGWSVLLSQVARVVHVCAHRPAAVVVDVRQVLAVSVRSLYRESIRELLFRSVTCKLL